MDEHGAAGWRRRPLRFRRQALRPSPAPRNGMFTAIVPLPLLLAASMLQLENAAESLLADRRGLCPQDLRLVKRELERLIAATPQDPLVPQLRNRLTELPR